MMSKEALRLALEALEYIYEGANNQGPHTGISWRCVSNKAEPAITALREALEEQPAQQEPVAWATQLNEYAHIKWGAKRPEYPMVYEFPLYTSPPAQRTWVNATTWRGLTDDELSEVYNQADWDTVNGWEYERAIEAKLEEKNT